jgi:hypothetical protein
MNPTLMLRQNIAEGVNIGTDTNVNGVFAAAVSGHVLIDRISAKQVVAVDPSSMLSGGPPQAAIDRVALTSIWFAHPTGDPSRIFLNDLNGIVRAPCIINEILKLGVSLQQDRPYRFFDKMALVKRRRDDTNPRTHSTATESLRRVAFFRPRPPRLACWRRRQL